jgi:dUTPase
MKGRTKMKKKQIEDVTANPIQLVYKGEDIENNIVKAKFDDPIIKKVAFNHRCSALIKTGVEFSIDADHKLCYRLIDSLSDKGLVALNAPGYLSSGHLNVMILNVGREIVEVKDGDPIVEIWVEKKYQFDLIKSLEG